MVLKLYCMIDAAPIFPLNKTIPMHKKGPRKDIENYRPIANPCSTSKIFEKLILKRILLYAKFMCYFLCSDLSQCEVKINLSF